ncbi:PREDICTED: uncharacterized protein LOC108561079 [Nicrophorus vespilloides]|uniref:Uncharacterized protein LOC108561079 n=1 Tax=Nicrophorus vespilloides TaxID=110193 RepID=A0ABM1MIF6_NICVS|nr:PREDICTED: uncharacterized protein LOC108561079 [Nicrophorus vespilloides]
MNTFIVVFAAALALANGGVIAPVGVVTQTIVAPVVKSSLIQGPSTSTHIVGPDGSQIIANAPGATIHTSEHVGAVSEVVAPIAPAVVAKTIVAAPALVAAAPTFYAAAPALIASPVLPNGYPLLAPGSGLEGQYVQDINEKLYDDGSYKGEIYA